MLNDRKGADCRLAPFGRKLAITAERQFEILDTCPSDRDVVERGVNGEWTNLIWNSSASAPNLTSQTLRATHSESNSVGREVTLAIGLHTYGAPKRPEVRRVSGFNWHNALLLRDLNEQAYYMGAVVQRISNRDMIG
ncbi:hypothetical protein [Rhabdaerophilum sp. SD176]|uniref:hypothetical protein n=1 Tax=Rhabdaerophilum sp. SD176 TaxID=2983548 RepID=UPI0024DF4627|nr:hypothetical protein [Rhabdaerophilum sp. SD176]